MGRGGAEAAAQHVTVLATQSCESHQVGSDLDKTDRLVN